MPDVWLLPLHRQSDDQVAYVNVHHIVAVEPNSGGGSIVNCVNGAPYRVRETVQQVLEMLPDYDPSAS